LEIRFYKRQVSFLVVKTVKCKRGIRKIYSSVISLLQWCSKTTK